MELKALYTTGYALWSNPSGLLRVAIDRQAIIADIRIVPTSQRPEWRADALMDALGWRYVPLRQLGNRNYKKPDQPHWLANEDVGLHYLTEHLKHNAVILLCVCKDCQTCHRSTVARLMKARCPDLQAAEIGATSRAVTQPNLF